jgi:Concanavalin A-like lectin/glucanases superfamily
MINVPYTTPVLLRGNGVDGSTTITDGNGRSVTVYGDAKVSTDRAMFTQTSSLKFDGTDDYMAIPYTADMALDGDFTIEAWVNLAVLPCAKYYCIASQSWDLPVTNKSWWFGVTKDATLGMCLYFSAYPEPESGGVGILTTVAGGSINQWIHVAAVRKNNAVNNFANGVAGTWVNLMKLNQTTDQVLVGMYYPNQTDKTSINGYISELRIVRGAALYFDSFTPPTAPLSLISGTNQIPAAPLPNGWIEKLDLGDPGQFLDSPKFISVLPTLRVGNMFYAGSGRVSGTVSEKHSPSNKPWHRYVLLLREPTLEIVRVQWSDPVTGAYSFDSVDATCTYTVISYDHTDTYRAVIADKQTAQAMP